MSNGQFLARWVAAKAYPRLDKRLLTAIPLDIYSTRRESLPFGGDQPLSLAALLLLLYGIPGR